MKRISLKRICFSLLLPEAIVACLPGGAFGQRVQKHPDPSTFTRLEIIHQTGSSTVTGNSVSGQVAPEAQGQASSLTLPIWNYSIVSGTNGSGATFQGSMVGRSPYYNGHRTTTVQAYLVPVILTFPDGTVFDPTTTDSCVGDSVMDLVNNSPLVLPTNFTFTDSNGQNPVNVGATQYPDAFQRGNFWKYVAPSSNLVMPYHTLLNYTVLPAQKVTVPSGSGFTNPSSCIYGVMNYTWWDNYVENTLIPNLAASGVGPGNLPIFIFDSVVMYLNNNETQCCALGDHGSVTSNPQQTYVVADFDTSGYWDPDIGPLSNELGKWIDDPLVTNATPPWTWPTGNKVGQSCSSLLEVGDPLSRNFQITMPNKYTYNPEELAYFSWFFDQVPSIGTGGWYSDQGYLTSDSGAACSGSTFHGESVTAGPAPALNQTNR